ncbi:MAG: LPS export ABC transporter periplasmic protein LptC [Armatimonadetes bacterium]|nr:LPS export ABC transporter periplasmic protein LptC [Armatimonadota bacterium]
MRWLALGLAVAAIPVLVWVLLQPSAPAPGPTSAPARPASEDAAPSTVAVASPATPPVSRASPPARPGGIPPVEVQHTSISSVDPQGRRQWDLRADSVVVDSSAGTATLTTVQGTYYQAGEPAMTFAAPRGTFYIATRNATLTGGVRARSTSGRSLEAEVVKWFPKVQQIEASGHVVLRQAGMTVRADRLTADVALQRTRLSGNIRVTVAE